MRIGGLASGMDIDSIVRDLMRVEKMPLDRLKQNKQTLEWQRDDYRSMNALLLDFRTKLNNMKFTTNYRARTVTSSDDSRVTATASSAANQGTYSITEVKQLAAAETWVTSSIDDGVSKVDPTKSLKSQSGDFVSGLTWETGAIGSQTVTGDGTAVLQVQLTGDEQVLNKPLQMSVKVNGKGYEVIDQGAAFTGTNQVKVAANGEVTFSENVTAGATVKVDYITDKKVQEGTLAVGADSYQLVKKGIITDGFSLSLDGGPPVTMGAVDPDTNEALLGSIGKINVETGKITFNEPRAAETAISVSYKQEYTHLSVGSYTSTSGGQPNEENFLIESSQSLNQVFSKVNSSNAGVSMFLDNVTGQVSMMRKETGDFYPSVPQDPPVADDIIVGGSFATSLKLTAGDITKTSGQNAVFTINGLETSRNSNTFTMSGVTFTLKEEFTSGPPATLSINNDGNQVFESIKSFVENYNTLIGGIDLKLNEEKYRSYKPLTDEQRSELSDKQQEQWDDKAKSGLIRRDPTLTNALSSMRIDFYNPVANEGTDPLLNQLAMIGIRTTSNFREGGKLEINEAKLKEAINNNPEAVEALFIGAASSTNESEQGIIHRLSDTVTETLDRLRDKAGNQFSTLQNYAIGKSIFNVDERIQRFEDRLIQVENRYWAQFTAMEQAVNRANSQGMYLMQQFGMGQ
ncbi:flagellar filament capping protein FliD [Jeotgalibacillus aurantiacus]|uniref:flagellar filament capping protein FliD n=1 Tax=Jeotgalibacillus aurantiacus TaxID=2763266 RepID=UPI001D0AA46E|nr:flagellar filament capping protein FliD [Jeotgalibacillus aurantiacus]